jgi:hypothetical protein
MLALKVSKGVPTYRNPSAMAVYAASVPSAVMTRTRASTLMSDGIARPATGALVVSSAARAVCGVVANRRGMTGPRATRSRTTAPVLEKG